MVQKDSGRFELSAYQETEDTRVAEAAGIPSTGVKPAVQSMITVETAMRQNPVDPEFPEKWFLSAVNRNLSLPD